MKNKERTKTIMIVILIIIIVSQMYINSDLRSSARAFSDLWEKEIISQDNNNRLCLKEIGKAPFCMYRGDTLTVGHENLTRIFEAIEVSEYLKEIKLNENITIFEDPIYGWKWKLIKECNRINATTGSETFNCEYRDEEIK